MKKVLIVIGLIIIGLTIGGGIAFWNNTKGVNDSTQGSVQEQSEYEKSSSNYEAKQSKLKEMLANAKTIEEYKQEFSKNKKYKENCLGDKPIDYSMFDINDINAANQAVACYQLKYDQKRGTKDADDEYNKFRDFYWDFSRQHAYLSEGDFNDYSDVYYKYGILIVPGEDHYDAIMSYRYIYENISPYLSHGFQEFIRFNIIFDKTIMRDLHFHIPKSELKKILEFYIDFQKKYPELDDKLYIQESIKFYENGLKTYPRAY